MTPQVDLEPTGLVVQLAAARVGTGEVARFPEVGAVVGEEGTEGDEGLLAPWRGRVKQSNTQTKWEYMAPYS